MLFIIVCLVLPQLIFDDSIWNLLPTVDNEVRILPLYFLHRHLLPAPAAPLCDAGWLDVAAAFAEALVSVALSGLLLPFLSFVLLLLKSCSCCPRLAAAMPFLTASSRLCPALMRCSLRCTSLHCTQVLLVVGWEDEVVPAANSRAAATRLQRPWLMLLEGGHAAFVQHQPVFLQVLDAFLSA